MNKDKVFFTLIFFALGYVGLWVLSADTLLGG
jgi:hypothetical protein